MSSRRFWWVLGAAIAASSSSFLACSSSSSSPGGGGDAGGSDAAPDAPGDDASDAGAHEGGGGDGACPTAFHPEPAGGIYCPSVAGDAGDSVCMMGQHCCMPSKMTGMSSSCSPQACGGSGMMAPKDWSCSAPSSCPTGNVCCAIGSVVASGTCGLPQIQMFKSTSCETACATGEIVICQAQSDCKTGTCTLATAGGAPVGICM